MSSRVGWTVCLASDQRSLRSAYTGLFGLYDCVQWTRTIQQLTFYLFLGFQWRVQLILTHACLWVFLVSHLSFAIALKRSSSSSSLSPTPASMLTYNAGNTSVSTVSCIPSHLSRSFLFISTVLFSRIHVIWNISFDCFVPTINRARVKDWFASTLCRRSSS